MIFLILLSVIFNFIYIILKSIYFFLQMIYTSLLLFGNNIHRKILHPRPNCWIATKFL
ncbi:hypothetical protein ABIE32_001369 [Comamonas sp. 4034]